MLWFGRSDPPYSSGFRIRTCLVRETEEGRLNNWHNIDFGIAVVRIVTCRLVRYPCFRIPSYIAIGSEAFNKVAKRRVWYQPTGRIMLVLLLCLQFAVLLPDPNLAGPKCAAVHTIKDYMMLKMLYGPKKLRL